METSQKTLKIALVLVAIIASERSANAACMCICQNMRPTPVCENSTDLAPDCSMNICQMQGMQGMQPYSPYQPTQPIQPDNSDPYHMQNNFPNPWK